MGIIRNGIFGGFTNKTGPLVGIRRGNLNIIRSLPLKSSKPATAAQLAQRENLGKISAFLSYLNPLIQIGYFKRGDSTSAMNRAVSANLKLALTDREEINSIDYTKISFSQGKLPLPALLQAKAEHGQMVKFLWEYHAYENKWKAAEDRCSVLIYNVDKHAFAFQINAAIRAEGQYSFALPSSFEGDLVYAYISFDSAFQQGLSSASSFISSLMIV